VVVQAAVGGGRQSDIDHHLQLLANPDERVRLDSVVQLGRLKAYRAVDSLSATLAGDHSPAVREGAARALGLIGSAKALPALQHAAQADDDRDVRHSAQFAAEVIRSNLSR
jgi:HEAT repeat protein